MLMENHQKASPGVGMGLYTRQRLGVVLKKRIRKNWRKKSICIDEIFDREKKQIHRSV
jgi:hypothetical protein